MAARMMLFALAMLLAPPLAAASLPDPTALPKSLSSAPAGTAPWRPTGLSLPRYLVDNHLVAAARAAGATVLEGHAVEDLLFTRGSIAGAMVRRPGSGTRRPRRAVTPDRPVQSRIHRARAACDFPASS